MMLHIDGDNPVADIDLIVEILALEMIQLEVEGRDNTRINMSHGSQIQNRTVQRTNQIVAYPLCIFGKHAKVYAFEHVRRKLPTSTQTSYHLI